MKINNKLIVTLVDFQRNFNFEQFWNCRRQFVRDMHPDKMYYWEESDKTCYTAVRAWIEAEDSGTVNPNIRKSGLESLSLLAGQEVTGKKTNFILDGTADYSADIIYVKSGRELRLPGKAMSEEEAMKYGKSAGKKERLHKIEIRNDKDEEGKPAPILINGTEVARLAYGECVYVTEIDGNFLRALPSHLNQATTFMDLINIPGSFGSRLRVLRYFSETKEYVHENVTQIAFLRGTYAYKGDIYYTIKTLNHEKTRTFE